MQTKPQYGIILYPRGCLWTKTLIIQVLVRMLKIKTHHTLRVGIYNVQPSKIVLKFLKKLQRVAIWPSSSTKYILKRTENVVYTKSCIWMFIAALFIIAKRWKQPKYLKTDEWINKILYIHIMGHYPTIKKNEVLTDTTTQMSPETIMVNKSRHIQKATILHDSIYRKYPEGTNSLETV